MTDIALYPGDRGTGKTTMLMQQVRQGASVGQTVLLVVPHASRSRDLWWEMREWDDVQKVPAIYSESNMYASRGLRPDHVFIDDADLFLDNPIELAECFQPGVPLTVTYTPRSRHPLDVGPTL